MSEFNEPPQPSRGDDELREESVAADHEEAITVSPVGKRKKVKEKKPKKGRSLKHRIVLWTAGILAVVVICVGGLYVYAWIKFNEIRKDGALNGMSSTPCSAPGATSTNILLMGLDSRLDENGQALPAAVYNALHAGGSDTGGYNSNVLMYIHICEGGAAGNSATAFSIPRDDWVAIPNCLDTPGMTAAQRKQADALRQDVGSSCMGKIKSAYGWQLDAAQRFLGMNYQDARSSARRQEVETVDQFLGVHINQFVEVTMAAFYEIAQQVQPIKVCVKENTTDTFSGANFKKGVQELSAKQAVAFVRQRRDAQNRYNFSDLDRERRQQAFIVSLLTQLKSVGTLADPFTLINIANVAIKNVVISDGLGPKNLADLASKLTGGNLHLYTLPIVTDSYYPFGPGGEVANQVNLKAIRSIVKNFIDPSAAVIHKPTTTSAKPKATTLPSGAGYTVNTVNASLVPGQAKGMLTKLTQFKYSAGTTGNAPALSAESTIAYNPADKAAAQVLAKRINGTVALLADSGLASHTLTLTIGSTLANTADQIRKTPTTSPKKHRASSTPTPVSATGGGTNGPAINQLTQMDGVGVPCVK